MEIFCYSGTGNCLSSAKQLAAALNMTVVHITDELASSKISFAGEMGIIIYPVYAYEMPKTVKRFILNNSFNYKYFAVLTTFGSSPGGAYAEAIRLFRKRKQRIHYTGGAKSVENFVHMFKLPPEDKIKQLTQTQRELTKSLAEDITTRKTNKRFKFRPFSKLISMLFRSVTGIFARRYRVTDACTGCEICLKICPANAITMIEKGGKKIPTFLDKKCDHCQSCLQLCPHRAIRFGKVQPESRRYCHADVKTGEMIKR